MANRDISALCRAFALDFASLHHAAKPRRRKGRATAPNSAINHIQNYSMKTIY
jgi:hypothetical protein